MPDAPANPSLPPAHTAVQIDLGEGEDIIMVLRPHWLYVALDRPMILILAILSGVGLWFVGDSAKLMLWAPALIWVLWQFAERASRRYILTTRRVVSIAGLLRQKVVDAPIANVRQVTLFRSMPERVLGLGTLAFATAGTGGQDIIWRLVDRPKQRFIIARGALDQTPGINE